VLYRRGRTWWVKFVHAGVRYRLSTGEADRRRAEAQGRRIRVEVETSAGPGGRPVGLALRVLRALDLERVEQQRLGDVRARTIRGLWAPLLRLLGERRDVGVLRLTDLDTYEGARRGEGVRGQTIRREVQTLVRGLGLAKRTRAIRALPFDPEDLRQIDSDAPKPQQQSKLWSADEIARILGALSKRAVTAGWRDRLRIIQLTGLRLEELRRLNPAAWVRGDELFVPASGAKTITGARAIPLPPEALAILARWRPVRGKPNVALALASHRAGVHAVLTPRDLRSWFLTQAGRADPRAAQLLAGHTSIATTTRYLHADSERVRAAARAAAEAAGVATELWPQSQNRPQRKPRNIATRARSSAG